MICNNPTDGRSDGIGSKRKALEMITNIFCKKSKECENLNANSEPVINNSDDCSHRHPYQHSLSVPESDNKSIFSDILPKSPISPRVKSIHQDMEALALSRQDNPYIMQQLERLSTKDTELLAEFNISPNSSPVRSIQKSSLNNLEPNQSIDTNFLMDSDISDSFDDNLHDKLIRSPPPQFPKNLSLFLFPGSSSASVQSYRTGENGSDFSPSRLFLSPNFSLSHRSRDGSSDLKNGFTNISHDNIAVDMKSRGTQLLEQTPNHYRQERRGSDSSIMSNNWKTSYYSQSMAASSSSLLSFAPRCPPIDSNTSVSNDSTMSCNECQFQESETEHKTELAADLMEIYSNFDDNRDNQMNFMSPSNSREALLKDISQVT